MLTELELVDVLSSCHASIEFLSDPGLEAQLCRVYFDDGTLSLSFRLLDSSVVRLSIDWESPNSGTATSPCGRSLHLGFEGIIASDSMFSLVGVAIGIIRQLSVA